MTDLSLDVSQRATKKKSTKKKIRSGSKTSNTKKSTGNKSRSVENTFNQADDYDVNDIINIIEYDILKNKPPDQPRNLSPAQSAQSPQSPQSPSGPQIPSILAKIQPDMTNPKIEINNTSLQSYIDSKKFLADNKIKISTITLDCKLGVVIDIDKLAKYVVLREDGIVSIKYGDRKNPATNRTIVAVKKKQSNRNFFNQVTILMKPTNNIKKNYINIKVFNNGSVQATGCTDIDDFNNVINTLIGILKKGQDIKNKNNKIPSFSSHYATIIPPIKEIGIFAPEITPKISILASNHWLVFGALA